MGEGKGNVKVFADSTCDLTSELLAEHDISVVPLYVTFDDRSYMDGVEINPSELYSKVSRYGKLPKTSAPTPGDFYEAFKYYIDQGRDIIYIALSSELSSTLRNAKLAAEQLSKGRITIIDSRNLSSGTGLLVLKAAEYARLGFSASEISAKVEAKIPKVQTAFVIDTLDYLYKGGRCTALQSIMGTMLSIKPIVEVVDGKMILAQKQRKRSNALNSILTKTLAEKDNIESNRIMITHSHGAIDAERLRTELAKKTSVKEVIVTEAGCVISSHCGPNTVGILYITE